ncbi:DUF1425 domain-containing protein [Azonexus fungiphilus]|jgi:uncharacterized protein YcfL|uniref:DUF1425 domain-containing protein n=1 Tax=Azonexus fungiphilus TaxID=146940 RepID=UPI00156B249E|nr:DUF1425 domain-containing protein [Azonexus fungiphilus]NHC07500.1 YcfL family protein [Azonexus fungiphilus]
MNYAKLVSSLLLGAGLLFAGAASAQSMAAQIEQHGESRYVTVSSLMAKERNGFMAIQFELANSDSDPQRAFWRIKWLDADGFQVWDDEPWKPVLVQARARQNISASAPTPKARDFRIQFTAEKNWSTSSSPANYPAN